MSASPAPAAPSAFIPNSSIYFFLWPQSKSVRLEKVFAVASAACGEALAIASNQRDKVLAATSHSLPQNVVAAIDDYLPYLHGMSAQVSTSGKLALKVSLDFLWTSSLLQKVTGETRYFLYHIFPEEAAHVYFLYGMATYSLARNTALHGVEDAARKAKAAAAAGAAGAAAAAADAKSGADYRVEVTRLMRTAAGIFAFMAQTLLPALSDRGSSKPPDVQVPVCEALSDMCLCLAQEMTIESGIAKGTSEGLLSKLCVGVSEKYSAARGAVARGLGHQFHALDQGWNLYLQAKAELYLARSYKLLGIAATKAAEHGKSVAYFNAALAKLQSINPPQANGSIVDLNKEVAAELAHCRAHAAVQLHDNAKIYFALVPKDPADFPQSIGKFMIAPLPYTPPKAAPGPFFSAGWTDGASAGAAVAAAAAAATPMASGAAAGLPVALPVPSDGAAAATTEWSCKSCTLSNKAAAIKCDACGAARPTAAPAAAAVAAPAAPASGPGAAAAAAAAAKPDAPALSPGGWAEQLGVSSNTHSITYAPQNF